ncbi:hypothetical protein QWZ17_13450 [Mucilaginibacter flavus]|nr:hypothetical protein [Mucilaginibacter flavus]
MLFPAYIALVAFMLVSLGVAVFRDTDGYGQKFDNNPARVFVLLGSLPVAYFLRKSLPEGPIEICPPFWFVLMITCAFAALLSLVLCFGIAALLREKSLSKNMWSVFVLTVLPFLFFSWFDIESKGCGGYYVLSIFTGCAFYSAIRFFDSEKTE